MAEPIEGAPSPEAEGNSPAAGGCAARKDKRKALKKLKRKQLRKEAAIKEREEEAARLDDPEEELRARERKREEAEIAERERQLFEERERSWLQAAAARKAAKEEEEEERRRKLMEAVLNEKVNEFDEDDEWDYIEEGPAEIIWKGNEITVKKKKIRVAKQSLDKKQSEEDDNRPTSNPLPPQSVAFASYMDGSSVSAQVALDRVAQEVPNFGTEQDKAHCPFHLKTGACRFGSRCSRVHFHPDKSCTLLIKNMYNGPGLAWEQDEGLEYTDEEVERSYEEFYEDVHTEFLKFGELVNFKVCNNGSYHLRGNVYVHYKSLDSAVLAYNSINGRYFAGKQILCEFVSLTRWKVAICGEYMKSRLKTCSHGSACNFIHCFRNPGGDYEWADWDNPPPKYWMRKMVALFGPSSEYENDKQVDCRDSERQRSSYRMRTPTNKSYHSHRSDSGGSPANDSEKTRDQQRRCSNRREHSSRSKDDPTFVEKHERFKEYDESVKRYKMHSYDYGEDIYENDRVKQQKHEACHYDDQEKHKVKDKEDLLRQKRGRSYSIEHMKSKRHKSKYHEKQEYGQSSDYAGDDRGLSYIHSDSLANDKSTHSLDIDEEHYNGRSNNKSSCRLNINEERYNGRSDNLSSHRHISIDEERYTGRSSEDLGYNADSSGAQHDAELTHRSSNASHDYKSKGRHSQFRKEKEANFRSEGSDPENVHDHLPRSRSRQRGKHDNSIKLKHSYGEGENEDKFEDERYTSS